MVGWWRRVAGVLAVTAALVAGGGVAPAGAAYDQQFSSDSWSPNRPANALARAGDLLYVGGNFTAFVHPVHGRANRQRLAALDATTGAPVGGFSPDVNGRVWGIAVGPDGTVYIGGEFTEVNGRPAAHLAALTASGELLSEFTADANDVVHDLVVTPTGLYAAGAFGQVNGTRRGGLVKLDRATGAVDTGFDAVMRGGRARAAVAEGDSIVVGGTFDSLGGAVRTNLGSVDPVTGAVTGWDPPPACDGCAVLDLAAGEGRIIGGTAGNGGRIASWSAATGAQQWVRRGDGDVQAVGIRDGIAYAAGHFGPTFHGQTRHQLAALTAGTGTLLPYQVAFAGQDKPGIWAVVTDPDRMYIAGAFRLQGTTQARFAMFEAVGSVTVPDAPTGVAGDLEGDEVQVSWSPPGSDGGAPVTAYTVTALPAPASGAVVCSTASTTCEVPVGDDDLRPGSTYTFSVSATNAVGTGASSRASAPVSIATGPAGVVADGPAWGTELDGRGDFAWSATGPGTVDSFEYQVRSAKAGRALEPWRDKPATDAEEVSLRLAPGVTKCVQVRAVDGVGNRSGFTSPVCRTAPLDDGSLRANRKVSRLDDAAAFRGTLSSLDRKKSRVTARGVRGDTAELVVTRCPDCGTVRVFYDGRRVARLATQGPQESRAVLALPDVSGVSKVKLKGTNKGPVLVDGLSVRAR